MSNPQKKCWTTIVALSLGACFALAPQAAAAAKDSPDVQKLFAASKTAAFQLVKDATEMESLAEANVSWRSNVESVDQVRDDVNFMGRELSKLDQLRETASSWQEDAISKMRPLLQELATNTTIVIDELNRDQEHFNTNAYRQYLAANADRADELSKLLVEFVNHGKAKHKFERLGDTLDVRTGD
jgi:hypothetical protein